MKKTENQRYLVTWSEDESIQKEYRADSFEQALHLAMIDDVIPFPDFDDGGYVCVVRNIATGETRRLHYALDIVIDEFMDEDEAAEWLANQ